MLLIWVVSRNFHAPSVFMRIAALCSLCKPAYIVPIFRFFYAKHQGNLACGQGIFPQTRLSSGG
jgi:hypothetical protein